jgi:hypothetical protein
MLIPQLIRFLPGGRTGKCVSAGWAHWARLRAAQTPSGATADEPYASGADDAVTGITKHKQGGVQAGKMPIWTGLGLDKQLILVECTSFVFTIFAAIDKNDANQTCLE